MGIGILLTGSAGTGKTMAASIIANTLGLELYRIDLSKMISKYIGETEKQLSQLFDTARKTGVVLFFDEADSIFGKRSKVQNAQDRYANVEVSYLLQKIEEYEGIVILASNFKENIDEAFLRRLRFTIEFPTPNATQRELLWSRLIPENLLEKPISFASLAQKFKLSGANIRNIALYAAFNAADDESKISTAHIGKALKNELDKIGLGYNEDGFKKLY
jgi:SpoVK/Ycf46/Vps4 family AAA+-type ATPase